MKTRRHKACIASAAFLCLAIGVRPACAGLLSNLNLDQEVFETDAGFVSGHQSMVVVTGTTIPFQQTATAQDQTGIGAYAIITANYSVTDNGSVAAMNINCSGAISAPYGYSVVEGSNETGSTFYINQPCTYSATFSCTGSTYGELDYNSSQLGIVLTELHDSSRTYAGSVAAGPFYLYELWELSNNAPPVPINQSGTDSISITFYGTQPIPEPPSAMLTGVPALALLARRPRIGRVSSAM